MTYSKRILRTLLHDETENRSKQIPRDSLSNYEKSER